MSENSLYRLYFFFGILFVMMSWEWLFPKRPLTVGRSRWAGNLGMTMINALIARYAVPFVPAAAAYLAVQRGWGLFNQISVPGWAAFILGVIILDMIIYLQHAMFHAMPLLWRVHMMHHVDRDIDVTTGLRFHPLEIVISLAIKLCAVVLIGVPPSGVIAFEIILNGMAMFNHGNVRMPAIADRFIRMVFVTPDMHRVHHSVAINETNSNFGFNLSLWDYLFGTYKAQPSSGHEKMAIGVSHLRELKWQNLLWMLALPFTAETGPYPLGRHGRKTGQ